MSAAAPPPVRVLFVCTGNSARSIMAEALLRHRSGARFDVFSAGTHPKSVNPLALRALAEVGIDASPAGSKSVDEFAGQPFDYVITVCDEAREACPVFPGARRTLHSGFEDPAAAEGTDEERLAVFRRIRDEIDRYVTEFASGDIVTLREQASG